MEESFMQRKTRFLFASLILLLTLGLAACAPAAAPAPAPAAPAADGATEDAACASYDEVTLQLKWVAQAQFAGYYAAEDQGFYEDQCINITINPGGPDIVPEQVVASGQADFGINFVPSLLSAREQGTNLINVAQVFQGSAMREIAWADSGIDSPDDLAGKRVAVWFGGNEFELLATLRKYDLDPETDLELIQQPFDMNLLLERDVDAAAAMTYNELAQVLETINPETGELYQLEDLNVIDFNEEGTAMLQDGIFTTESWLSDEANHDITVRFLRASFMGWIYCRDNAESCVDSVLQRGPALPRGHQTWMMNEINKLIWPSTAGIGIMSPDLFQQTADIALEFGVIQNPASDTAYTTAHAEAAHEGLDMDPLGADWQAMTVELTEGGQ
jgi:NitT/TauT family transport system substrate-binding protein